MSRSKAVKLNMIAGLFSEFVVLISGLILPRLILLHFGSASNGLVSSILQFLGFSAILRAGIGGATRAALYKPLAEQDIITINGIMAATSRHMKKVGTILVVGIIIFSIIYPFIVENEYDWFYTFSMVLIIGAGTLVDNFFGIKYKILLQADQKYYIQIGASTITNILATIFSIFLILLGSSMLFVRLGITIISLINPLLLNVYIRKHYNIDWKAKPNNLAINQRWDAFFHQLAAIINQNIDLVLLTLYVSLKEVSVYTVHFMVVNNVSKIINSCVTGVNSTFGNIMANNENKNLKTIFFFIEWAMMSLCTVLLSVTAVMLPSFITLYTSSITDVNYLRPTFAVLMVIVSITGCTRIPYQMLVEAAGKFKETRTGAILEVIVNLTTSIIFVNKFGIIGVVIGTLIAGVIRTIEYAVFCIKKILHVNSLHILRHYILLAITFTTCYTVGVNIQLYDIVNYTSWAGNAIIVTVSSILITCIVGLVFYKQQVKYLISRIKQKIIRGERYD